MDPFSSLFIVWNQLFYRLWFEKCKYLLGNHRFFSMAFWCHIGKPQVHVSIFSGLVALDVGHDSADVFLRKMGLKNLPIEIQDRRRIYLALGIAIVQSLAVSLNLPIVSGVNASLAIFMEYHFINCRTFFLVWLSDLNSLFTGLEAPLLSWWRAMMANLPYQIMDSIEKARYRLGCLASWFYSVWSSSYFRGCAEGWYRISINKINIHNRFKQYSYLDIMLNPVGGCLSCMPCRWLVFRSMFLCWFNLSILKASGPVVPSSLWQSVNLFWLVVYLIMLFVLGLAFAFVNVSGEQNLWANAQVRWVYLRCLSRPRN